METQGRGTLETSGRRAEEIQKTPLAIREDQHGGVTDVIEVVG